MEVWYKWATGMSYICFFSKMLTIYCVEGLFSVLNPQLPNLEIESPLRKLLVTFNNMFLLLNNVEYDFFFMLIHLLPS
jgi:hypothetical protein